MKTLRPTRLKGWYEYYREICPICGKVNGCMINENGTKVVCIRVPSEQIFSKRFESWLHVLVQKETLDKSNMPEFHQGHKKAPDEKLNQVFRALLETTSLTDEHYRHLTSAARQMQDNEIFVRAYRSFPKKPWETTKQLERLLHTSSFEGIPGFYKSKYGNWAITGFNGILIPYRNCKNQIIGFQYRIDQPKNEVSIDKDDIPNLKVELVQPNFVKVSANNETVWEEYLELGETKAIYYKKHMGMVKLKKGMRYFWLSSATKLDGTGSGNPSPVHVAVPTAQLRDWKPGTIRKADSVWLTEGALKADIAVEHLPKIYKPHELKQIGDTILAVPGTNTWAEVLPVLKEMEVKTVNLAFDMDAMTIPQVKIQVRNLAKALHEQGHNVNLVLWNEKDSKGLDDLFVNRLSPEIRKLF